MKKQITLIHILTLVSIHSFAQVPNNDFANWTNMGNYYNPVGWGCLNNRTAATDSFTCFRAAPGVPGNYYLKLVSEPVPGMGVLPGIACSGVLDSITMQPISGFAYNQRPPSFTGIYQYMTFYGANNGYINVFLSKWDSVHKVRDTIAYTHYILEGMSMQWTDITIPLTYYPGKPGTSNPLGTSNPDSAIILLSSDGNNGVTPVQSSYLWASNLYFSGLATGISEYTDSKNIPCYPNPVSDNLTINLSGLNNANVSIKMMDVLGNQVYEMGATTTAALATIDVSAFANGVYYIVIQTKAGETYTKSIIKF